MKEKMVSVTRRFTFEYGHCLPDHEGTCANTHGHSGVIELEVTRDTSAPGAVGPVETRQGQPDTGMVIDLGNLKQLAAPIIHDYLDHCYLNESLPAGYQPPTAENIAEFFFTYMSNRLLPWWIKVLRVRVYETENSWAEIKSRRKVGLQ